VALDVVIHPQLLFYEPEELQRWKSGDRGDCRDPILASLSGTAGFGEHVVARHYEALGYHSIHHDFDVFGSNRPGKYPRSEKILADFFTPDARRALRTIYPAIKPFRQRRHVPIEQPDLLVFRPDGSDLRFAEGKRVDTRDKLNPRQFIGLAFIAAILSCPVEVFIVARTGTAPSVGPIRCSFPVATEPIFKRREGAA
jgi:hypothetical protein